MNIVADAHRLPYQRALLRAWSNIAKTEAVQFYNITDPDSTPNDAVGFNVKTNAAGYLYTMDNVEISCLAVNVPAIIEVSLDNGGSWPVQWITGLRSETPISAADIHKLYFKNANGVTAVFDPLAGDQTLPDYALKSDIPQGLWAEGTLEIDGDTPANLTISAWTHSIYNSVNRSGTIFILAKSAGREGQVITVANGYSGSVLTIRTTYGDTNTDTNLEYKDVMLLVRCDNNGWIASKPIKDVASVDISTCLKQAQMQASMPLPTENTMLFNGTAAPITDSTGNLTLGPNTAALIRNGNVAAIRTNNGLVTSIGPGLPITKTLDTSEAIVLTCNLGIVPHDPATCILLNIGKYTMDWPSVSDWWGNHAGKREGFKIAANFILQPGVPYYLIIYCDYTLADAATAGCYISIDNVMIYNNDTKQITQGILACGTVERRDVISNGVIQRSYYLWTPMKTI